MHGTWCRLLVAVLAATFATSALTSGQTHDASTGVLDEHPSIQYARRPTTDRAAKLNEELAHGRRSFERDARTGFLVPLLNAFGVPVESQLLVFSKTGVQRAFTSPRNPRALFFDESVVVGYVPGAPAIEVAAHDPQQGVVFYTLDQAAAAPTLTRRTSCLSCHVSASTLDVPGIIVRSNFVDEAGNVMPQLGGNDVDHRTGHPDRWGGWFVTSNAAPAQYPTRAHAGNITFAGREITSNQVFIDWLNSAPETRGYLSSSSDVAALLLFDHQMRAVNLLTRLNWESRIASTGADASTLNDAIRRLGDELADYFLFVDEAPLTVPSTAPADFAKRLESRIPKDHRGRSFGQLDLVRRLLRYPCSYMIYSPAFDGLPPGIRQAVYSRMTGILSGTIDAPARRARASADDRRDILEILRDTKPDFPAVTQSR